MFVSAALNEACMAVVNRIGLSSRSSIAKAITSSSNSNMIQDISYIKIIHIRNEMPVTIQAAGLRQGGSSFSDVLCSLL